MAHILIVEGDPADTRTASVALAQIGLGEIDAVATVWQAHRYLDEVREHKRNNPRLILLDLALRDESGFAILRRWRRDRTLSAIPVVVWTQTGTREQELCRLFGLMHVIPKSANISELQDAVKTAVKSRSRLQYLISRVFRPLTAWRKSA